MRQIPNSLAAPFSWVYLFLFWCKWRLVDIFLHCFFFLSPLPLTLSFELRWPRHTWILSVRGNVGICSRHGKNKQLSWVSSEISLNTPCLETWSRKRGLTRFFLRYGLLIIYPSFFFFFSHFQAKFTWGLRSWPLIPHGKQTGDSHVAADPRSVFVYAVTEETVQGCFRQHALHASNKLSKIVHEKHIYKLAMRPLQYSRVVD